jgi:hypothetical protein
MVALVCLVLGCRPAGPTTCNLLAKAEGTGVHGYEITFADRVYPMGGMDSSTSLEVLFQIDPVPNYLVVRWQRNEGDPWQSVTKSFKVPKKIRYVLEIQVKIMLDDTVEIAAKDLKPFPMQTPGRRLGASEQSPRNATVSRP